MITLYYEILRKIFRQSFVVIFALVFCACIIQSSKFMYLVSNSHTTVSQLFYMVGLLSVDVTANVYPIALSIAICVVLYKFKKSNQMIAMQSFGIPVKALLKPVFVSAYISAIILYAITLYLSPLSLQKLKVMKVQLINNISLPKHAGNLINCNGLSVFAQEYIGQLNFKKLIIIDNRTSNTVRIYYAESGNLKNGIINLKHGEIKEFDKSKKRMSLIKFASHSYDLNEFIKKLSLNFSPHEMSSYELLKNLSVVENKAELHNRLITPLLAILLALIAFLCICSKNNGTRNTSSIEIIYSVLLIILCEGIALWFSNMISKNEDLILQYYIFVIVMIGMVLSLIKWRLNR